MTKLIGILGGMGPQASAALYDRINQLSAKRSSPARNADFPHMLISNLPVPDLISDKDAENKTVSMAAAEAERLDKAGVTNLFMPCNTMHLFAPQITQNTHCKFHSIVDIVVSETQKNQSEKIFILGTNTTIKSKLYQNVFDENNIKFSEPSDDLQEKTVEVILKTIANDLEQDDLNYFKNLAEIEAKKNNCTAILLACTELPLIIDTSIGALPTISSLQMMANKIFNVYHGNS